MKKKLRISVEKSPRIPGIQKRDFSFLPYSFNSFQIRRILFKPINRARVRVKAANRKPK